MEEKKEIILGIDPGTRITGYGIICEKNSNFSALDYGCITPPPSLPLGKRYRIIFESILDLIDRFHPTVIAVETQYVKKNAQSAIKLAMARGMVLLAAELRSIPLFEYAPKKAKLAVVGHGQASKEQLQKMIQFLLNLSQLPSPHDAADGLALAICHAHTRMQNIRENPCMNM